MRIMTPEEVRRDNARAEASAVANVPDTAERDAAELAIVRLIAGLARRYDAVQDILSMSETGIPELQALAVRKGVPQEDFNALISEITPLKWQLEAVTGGTWAECWVGFKSRIQAHVAALMREMAQ